MSEVQRNLDKIRPIQLYGPISQMSAFERFKSKTIQNSKSKNITDPKEVLALILKDHNLQNPLENEKNTFPRIPNIKISKSKEESSDLEIIPLKNEEDSSEMESENTISISDDRDSKANKNLEKQEFIPLSNVNQEQPSSDSSSNSRNKGLYPFLNY